MNFEQLAVNDRVAAAIYSDSTDIFDYEDVKPKEVKKGFRGMVLWGADNDLPALMMEKIRVSEVLSSNKLFNSLLGYGRGLNVKYPDGAQESNDVKLFLKRNHPGKFLWEQITDQKYFYFSIAVIILSNDGKKIVKLKHKDVNHARFETNNPKTGKIENVFFAVWENNPKDEDIQVYPVLDEDDPIGDLMIRMGKEVDPETGKNRKATTERKFAIITRFPTPGYKYYPFPPYAAHFNSGWYDVATMIPVGKRAKMENGLIIKYHVEIHRDYFEEVFKTEKIPDPDKKIARKKLEFENIKNFLSGLENAGKVWYSGYYIDPNGKEVSMIRITVLDTSKEGGDWVEDAEEVANVQCYADGVHPSLIGAVPGKAKGSLSGSDKRELFTMKQAIEKPFRDLTLIPYQVIQEYNGWPPEIIFEIPDMLLTTLDKGTDAKVSNPNPNPDDNNND